jgi:hypothetical protein
MTPLVFMERAEMLELPEYSVTLPTGTTIGKRWRRRDPQATSGWTMGEYVPHADPALVGIRWREIALTS